MKILFLAGSFNQGGAEYQLLALANLMQEKGHKVHILAITDHDFFKAYLHEKGLSYECLNNSDNYVKRVWIVSRKFILFKPDAIISFMKVPSLVTIFGKFLSGTDAKILLCERTALVKPFRDFVHFNFWRFANVITTNSVSKIDYFKRNFPSLYSKLTLVSNIYEQKMLDFSFDEILKSNVGHNNNLVYVGRVAPEKNIHILLYALGNLLLSGEINFTLSIYGDSRHKEYHQQLCTIIEEKNLKEYVEFKGAVSQDKLKNIYLNTGCLCLLSEYEGFSNVLAECLIHGCIVLSSNIPENAAVVKDKENGFLVSTKSVDSVQGGLMQFFNLTINERLEIRKRNFLKARVLFNHEVVYKKYIQLLNV